MPLIPSIMLKRLYVRGSLQNTADGFQLAIRNTLAAGTIVALGPITVDSTTYEAQAIAVEMGGVRMQASEITAAAPQRFNMGTTAIIRIKANALPDGPHEISITTDTREAGRLVIESNDSI